MLSASPPSFVAPGHGPSALEVPAGPSCHISVKRLDRIPQSRRRHPFAPVLAAAPAVGPAAPAAILAGPRTTNATPPLHRRWGAGGAGWTGREPATPSGAGSLATFGTTPALWDADPVIVTAQFTHISTLDGCGPAEEPFKFS